MNKFQLEAYLYCIGLFEKDTDKEKGSRSFLYVFITGTH